MEGKTYAMADYHGTIQNIPEQTDLGVAGNTIVNLFE